ncbi:MAG: BON domain-containing protein [Candidatus Obscuribacterales bacterium]|nr:BON domain-containing protein [Candidatus Obscuribacterales bacterium]
MKNFAMLAATLSLVALNTAALAAAPKADNSAQNKGATEKNAVTAEKQKSPKDQVTVLAEIRKNIVDDSTLSMNAKNVKILYAKGIVTLRGPVESDAEKTAIEADVKKCDAVGSIKNLLTVALKK